MGDSGYDDDGNDDGSNNDDGNDDNGSSQLATMFGAIGGGRVHNVGQRLNLLSCRRLCKTILRFGDHDHDLIISGLDDDDDEQ